MSKRSFLLYSTLGRKFLMGLTGLALFIFVAFHLGENLLLFLPDSGPYNAWAHRLETLGPLLYLAEVILVAFFLIHIVAAIKVTLENRKARPVKYQRLGSAGPPSRKSISSRTMIWTGLVLLAFLVIHIKDFKYGPGIEQGYVTHVQGVEMRDLYKLVHDDFSQGWYAAAYVFVMLLLGFHLRHGFWSAFQSLGVNHPKYTPIIYGFGVLSAILLALGFLVIPVWLFFTGGS